MSPNRRLFSRRRTAKRQLPLLLVFGGLLAGVAACAPEGAYWSPAQSPKRNEVRWITFEHTARFAPGKDILSVAERQRLKRFLTLHDAGYGDQVMVGALGSENGSDAATKAGRREAAVLAEIRQDHLSARMMPRVPSSAAWDGSVHVVLGRFIVIPPDCPDWSKRADGDPANRESSNFGCATAIDLGLMVANPEDLVRGHRPGPADGAVGARLYDDYRTGKLKPPPSVTSLDMKSGVGGSSSGSGGNP